MVGLSHGVWIAVKLRFHWTRVCSADVLFCKIVKLTFRLEEAGIVSLLGTSKGT